MSEQVSFTVLLFCLRAASTPLFQIPTYRKKPTGLKRSVFPTSSYLFKQRVIASSFCLNDGDEEIMTPLFTTLKICTQKNARASAQQTAETQRIQRQQKWVIGCIRRLLKTQQVPLETGNRAISLRVSHPLFKLLIVFLPKANASPKRVWQQNKTTISHSVTSVPHQRPEETRS